MCLTPSKTYINFLNIKFWGTKHIHHKYKSPYKLEMEQTATYGPQVPLTMAALLPHSAGMLNRGPEGPSPLSGAGSHCL